MMTLLSWFLQKTYILQIGKSVIFKAFISRRFTFKPFSHHIRRHIKNFTLSQHVSICYNLAYTDSATGIERRTNKAKFSTRCLYCYYLIIGKNGV